MFVLIRHYYLHNQNETKTNFFVTDVNVKCLAVTAINRQFEMNASFSMISMQTGCYETGV